MNLDGFAVPMATVGGVMLLVAAVARRLHTRRRTLASLQLAIEDADPILRRAALRALGSRGLTNFAELLVHRALVETDAPTRQTLVEVVCQNDWEPADNRDLLTLRLWAHAQAEGGVPTPAPAPAVASTSSGPSAEPAAVAQAAPRATGRRRTHARGSHAPVHAAVGHGAGLSADAGLDVVMPSVPVGPRRGPGQEGSSNHRADSGRRPARVFDWTEDRPPGAPRRAPTNGFNSPAAPLNLSPDRRVRISPSATRVSKDRVTAIVTGAGGAAGIAVVRAMKAAGHRVVAADADPLAAGLRLGDRGAVIAAADDPSFVPVLCQLAVAAGAQVIVPTVAEELTALADAGGYLQADAGVRTWVPTASAVEACCDKWEFAQLLHRHGILGPATGLGSADGIPGPWVVKPRSGRGSRDVYLVEDLDDMPTILRRVPDPLVQTRLTGREFTVDTLVGRDGILAGAVPRWRLETKAGISTKGRTFADDRLVRDVARLLAIVGLCGPANVQGFVDHEGTPWFVEINPRFSGGLPLSLAAGADLVGEYVRGVLGQPIRPERLAFRPDVTMIRHFEETFE